MKIINYGPTTFNDHNYISKFTTIDVYNKLIQNNFSKNYFHVDRTKTIPHFLDIDYSYSPIPSSDKFTLNFNEVVKNRCIELLSLEKKINVSWSGGIDSTFVLLSLYHYANDPDQIHVYGTYNSIIESGNFYDKFIKNKINNLIRVNSFTFNNFIGDENSIYVTGAMSNQLFIPGIEYNKNRDCMLGFKDGYNIHNSADKFYKDVLTESCVEFLYDCIQKSPKQINTLQELRWYINFNFTWYNVLTTALIGLEKDTANRVHAFFNTKDFQLWSIYNDDPATKTGDYVDERWQLREAITDYTGDSTYSKIKTKKTSVLSTLPHDWLYLLNDYTNIYL